MAVSFTESVKPHLTVLRFDYNDAGAFVLVASASRKYDDGRYGTIGEEEK